MKRLVWLLTLLLLPLVASAQLGYRGDIDAGDTIRFTWNTFGEDGSSITRATDGTISVYKDGDLVQSTAGVTDTEDYDGVTGMHMVTVDTSADSMFYTAGSNFQVVVAGAIIDGATVNASLGNFSIANRNTDATIPGTINTLDALLTNIWSTSVDSGLTALQALCFLNAVLVNKADFDDVNTVVFRNANDTQNLLTVVTGSGDRTSVVKSTCNQ